MVPGAGLEPARFCKRGILSPLCLPIPPPGLELKKYLLAIEKGSTYYRILIKKNISYL